MELSSDAHTHTQAELESQRERGNVLELETDALKQQMADLREKLIKAQRDFDDLKSTMENMVPRCVCVCDYVPRCVCVCDHVIHLLFEYENDLLCVVAGVAGATA